MLPLSIVEAITPEGKRGVARISCPHPTPEQSWNSTRTEDEILKPEQKFQQMVKAIPELIKSATSDEGPSWDEDNIEMIRALLIAMVYLGDTNEDLIAEIEECEELEDFSDLLDDVKNVF